MPSFDSNILFVYSRAKGARARVYFPATYFAYLVTRIASEFLPCFLVKIMKDKPYSCKNAQLRESINMFKSIYWLISLRN